MFCSNFGVKIETMKRILRPFLPLAWILLRVYWFIFRPIGYGVKAVIICDNDVLLIRHTYGKRNWTFPGGGVKAREAKEVALKREVMEEIGIDLEKTIFAGSFVSSKEFKKDNVSVYISRVKNRNAEKDDFEIAETRWFPSDKMPKLLENAQKIFNLSQQYLKNNEIRQ